jgi:hypothetical protein
VKPIIFLGPNQIFLLGSTWHLTDGDVGGCGLRSEVVHKDTRSCPHPTLEAEMATGWSRQLCNKMLSAIPVGGHH